MITTLENSLRLQVSSFLSVTSVNIFPPVKRHVWKPSHQFNISHSWTF